MFHTPAHKQVDPTKKPGQIVNVIDRIAQDLLPRTVFRPTLVEPQPPRAYDWMGQVMAYDAGELDEDDAIILFQHLIDTGLAWTLQGHYGRTAQGLIQSGQCTPKA